MEVLEWVFGVGFWAWGWWAVRLSMGNRFVGWTSEVKNVGKEVGAGYSRW